METQNSELSYHKLDVTQIADKFIDALNSNFTNPKELLSLYQLSIMKDDYARAEGIHLALAHTNYRVSDTHQHIKNINENFWKDLRISRETGYGGHFYEHPNIKKFNWSKEQQLVLKLFKV